MIKTIKDTQMTDTLVSARLNALRSKFREHEHGGHCFGSEDMVGLVREIGHLVTAVKALEDENAGLRRKARPMAGQMPGRACERPALRPGAVPIGTIMFVPAEPRALS